MLEIMLLLCHGLWELVVRKKNCLSLSSKTNGVISRSLFLMPGIELKPQHLVRKWLWPDLCLKISLFGCKCIWRNACESMSLCNNLAMQTTVSDGTNVISGKQGCGVLCGVKTSARKPTVLWRSGALTAKGRNGNLVQKRSRARR